MKNNNYICHLPYLMNSIAYSHGFWYTCVKWCYLQVGFFFSFFSFFIFWAVMGWKGKKLPKMKNNNQYVLGKNNCVCSSWHVLCYGCMQLCAIQNSFATYDGTSFVLVVLTRLIVSEPKYWVTWSHSAYVNLPFLRGIRIQYFSVSA